MVPKALDGFGDCGDCGLYRGSVLRRALLRVSVVSGEAPEKRFIETGIDIKKDESDYMKRLFMRSMLLSLLFAPEAAEIETRYGRSKGRAKAAASMAYGSPAHPNPLPANPNDAVDPASEASDEQALQAPPAKKLESEL